MSGRVCNRGLKCDIGKESDRPEVVHNGGVVCATPHASPSPPFSTLPQVSVHPFTGGTHPTDVRMTTRFKQDDLLEGLTGAEREGGGRGGGFMQDCLLERVRRGQGE